MTMQTRNGYGAQALDVNVLGKVLEGSAVLSGCTPSVGANDLEIDVASGSVVVDGTEASVSAQTVTLEGGDPSPRKDVVYVDGTGAAQVAKGVAESPKPSNATGRATYRPSPPDLHATAAAVVAEVWVAAGASDVVSEDVTDRRVVGTVPTPLVDVGYVVADTSNSTPYTQSVTTGFEPQYVEFYGNLHQAAVGSLYYSGSQSGGGDNAISHSEGYAAGSATGDQVVSMVADNSDSSTGHRTYVGDGEVVHLIESSSSGDTLDGRVRANLSSLDSGGFTLEWTANYEAAPVLYRAFR